MHVGYIRDACGIHVGCMWDTCGIHVGNMWDTSSLGKHAMCVSGQAMAT